MQHPPVIDQSYVITFLEELHLDVPLVGDNHASGGDEVTVVDVVLHQRMGDTCSDC